VPEEPCSGEPSPGGADTLGDSTRKRKLTDDKYTLTWTPPVSPGTENSLKKARTTSPTVCPSLVFSSDTATDYNSPWQEFTEPTTEPCLFNGTHSSPAVNDAFLNLECRPETSLSSDFSLADRALSDDNLFSEFIRSPSPSCLSSATVSHGDSLIVSIANSTTNYNLSSPDDYSTSYSLPKGDETKDQKQGPRLRLRVRAPRPKITLRFTKPTTKDQGKRRPKLGRRRAAGP
jgi:hypothetical protein